MRAADRRSRRRTCVSRRPRCTTAAIRTARAGRGGRESGTGTGRDSPTRRRCPSTTRTTRAAPRTAARTRPRSGAHEGTPRRWVWSLSWVRFKNAAARIWKRLICTRTDRKRGSSAAARLGEHTTRATPTRELDAAALVADAHAHLGRARLNAELAEQSPQVGIRAVVVDDESGVDREPGAGGVGHVVGVCMATEPSLGFVEGHLALLCEHVGGGQTGDTGANNGNRSTVAKGAVMTAARSLGRRPRRSGPSRRRRRSPSPATTAAPRRRSRLRRRHRTPP